jgi:prepilin-type N-terminal cleavage/methylation domain-containing protein/uncharacterized repeat protein (TIGR02543 family)
MQAKSDSFNNREGFTMIEVVVTLVILAIIAAFTIPTYLGFVKDSQAKECAAYTAMLTRDCQQAQKDLTKSPTEIVRIDGSDPGQVAIKYGILFQAISDEFNVDLASGKAADIKAINKDGIIMVTGICKDGGNYYIQTENGSINIYCDKHDGMIPDTVVTPVPENPDDPVENNVTIRYIAGTGGSVSNQSDTIDAQHQTVKGSMATANSGYTFVDWTRDGNTVSTNPAFVPSLQETATYTANFKETDVTLTYVAESGGKVNPTSETIKAATGKAAGSTATPNANYIFAGWFDSSKKQVGNQMSFIPPKGDAYTEMTYTAKFIEVQGIDTVSDVESYFDNLYTRWHPHKIWGWWPWYYEANTKIGAVYSCSYWLLDWIIDVGLADEVGTYVSIDRLDQDFTGWFPTTDNFYRALSPEERKKFIRITDATPLYKSSNVSSAGWTTSLPPSFGNLYEYGGSVYIWTSEDPAIIPPTDPTASEYWVKIVKY